MGDGSTGLPPALWRRGRPRAPAILQAMTPVQVFEAESGDLVIAFLGTMGSDGLLIWRGDKGWGFHEAQSVTWDSMHQATYRNHRATVLDAAALKERGIPWPDPTAYRSPSRQWKDNFASEVPFNR